DQHQDVHEYGLDHVTPNDNTGNDSASASTTQAGVAATSDVSITKTAPATVPQAGGNITYAIKASHTGNTAAAGVTRTDTLPAGVTFVSATPSQGTCTGTATVTCSLGSLAAGTRPPTVSIFPSAPAYPPTSTRTFTNTASITGTPNDNTGNDSASA